MSEAKYQTWSARVRVRITAQHGAQSQEPEGAATAQGPSGMTVGGTEWALWPTARLVFGP